MEYIKIKFTFGLDCEGYQEIQNGKVARYLDLDGNELDMSIPTESYVLDGNPERPAWAVERKICPECKGFID